MSAAEPAIWREAINTLELLHFAPGDVAVITTPARLTAEQREAIRLACTNALPAGTVLLVLDGGVAIDKLTRAELEALT